MAATPPELKAILEQVEAELMTVMLSGETATITIHCGRGDLAVEVVSRRKHDPVRLAGKAQ